MLVVEITHPALGYGPSLYLEMCLNWEEWQVLAGDGSMSRLSRAIRVVEEGLGDWRVGFICVWQ